MIFIMEHMNNSLNIGAARIRIDIPEDFFPYRSFRGRLYTGKHDDIHARCIIITNQKTSALILSIELGDLGDIDMWLEKISLESNVPKENIFITVTHTHEAPHVSDSYNQKVEDVDKTILFGEYVWKAVRDAIYTAKANMEPGRIGYGTGQCDINVNRDFEFKSRYTLGINPHGISDKTVAVVKFEDLKGEVIAYFINYAVHGTVMFDSKIKDGGMLVSGDLPGETSRIIEKRYQDNIVALWTSGAAGDQAPKYSAKRMTYGSNGDMKMVDALEAGYLLLQVQAESLANEVFTIADNMKKISSQSVIKGIHKSYIIPGKKKAENPFNIPEDYKYEDGAPVNLHLSLLLINSVVFVGIPGELVCSIGIRIKNSFDYRNVIVVTHCNGSISYMSDETGFDNKTFEALVSHVKRGCAEEAIINGAADMLEELID